MIHFNVPPYSGNEINYIQQAIANHKICGDGELQKNAVPFLKKITPVPRYFLQHQEPRHLKWLRFSAE